MAVAEQVDPIIRVRNLTKRYRRHDAVRSVDLSVRRGEIYGLIGPDGSGKSSLLKAVAGVLDFDEGTVEVFGNVINSEAAGDRIKGRIAFMPQGLGQNLYAELSVNENIDFFGKLRLVQEPKLKVKKTQLLEMTRLTPFKDRPMKQLSGGMKQKLGLVCSLIHQPELIILDEPTTGVDPVSRRDFWAILAQLLHDHNITAIISTAYMDEASRFHRVSLLHEGRVMAEGEPSSLRTLTPGALVVIEAHPQGEALARLRREFLQVESVGSYLRVFVRGEGPVGAKAAVLKCVQGLLLKQCKVLEPELEDVVVALLNHDENRSTKPTNRPPTKVGTKMDVEERAIWAENLVRDFGEFRAVDHLSFEVRQGEIFGLLGANGAGKTTAIKMLTGILRPTSGLGHVAGMDMRSAADAIKSRIGYMSQAFSLYADLRVVENLRLYAGIYGLQGPVARSRVQEIIDVTGLHGCEREMTQALPMGIRQRLALGCALLHRPRILFLDEPTSGVDPVGRRRFWDILFRLSRDDSVTVLVTTHYMSESEQCDHLVLMHAGRSIADSSPEEMKIALRREAGSLLELDIDQPIQSLDLLTSRGYQGVSLFGNHVHLLAPAADHSVAEIAVHLRSAGLSLRSAREIRFSMEDVFVYRIQALSHRAGMNENT